MSKRPKSSSALKHGAYSGLTLLPGENRLEFERFRRELIAEFRPQGRLEEEIVADIARLTWRKRNLGNYELTQLISIVAKLLTTTRDIAKSNSDKEDTINEIDVYQVLSKDAEINERSADVIKRDKDLKELDLRKMATLEGLLKELDVDERLGAMIDKCLKRLLFVRGIKSVGHSNELPLPRQRA
ncbi:MAG: hypothetical protein U1E81_09825 [Xanthobacteraceae bacterium]